jgi:hypothetical protein
MVLPENELQQESMTTLRRESFGEVGLSAATVLGAMGGAIAGSVLGTELGTAFPTACGALGTVLGSGLAAGAWLLFEHLHDIVSRRSLAPRDRGTAPEPTGTRGAPIV